MLHFAAVFTALLMRPPANAQTAEDWHAANRERLCEKALQRAAEFQKQHHEDRAARETWWAEHLRHGAPEFDMERMSARRSTQPGAR